MYLPRHLATTRILELPSVDLKEIDDIIGLHIGKQTPYSREEIIYSYKIMGRGKEGCTRVFLLIARRNLIDERAEIMVKACIKPKAIGLSSEGVLNWFNMFYAKGLISADSQAVVVIDIDSNYSDFMVIYKGILRFSKNILIGANHLIEENGVYLNKFADEAEHSVKTFNEEAGNITPVKVCLSGAAKHIPGLKELLAIRFGLPCEVLDPFKNIIYTDKSHIADLDTRVISLSPLLGILTKPGQLEFDLMPREMRLEHMMDEKRKHLTWTGILVSAVILMLSLLLAVGINNKKTYIAVLNNKSAALKDASEDVQKMRLMVNLFHERQDASGDALNLLNEIIKLIPREIYLTSIDIENRGKVVLKGRADAIADVYKFVTALGGSVFLEKVRNTYATTKEENDTVYADFEIVAECKKTSKR